MEESSPASWCCTPIDTATSLMLLSALTRLSGAGWRLEFGFSMRIWLSALGVSSCDLQPGYGRAALYANKQARVKSRACCGFCHGRKYASHICLMPLGLLHSGVSMILLFNLSLRSCENNKSLITSHEMPHRHPIILQLKNKRQSETHAPRTS